ncbi:hypothetical protein JZ751_018353, partial [Albula glossodonta]
WRFGLRSSRRSTPCPLPMGDPAEQHRLRLSQTQPATSEPALLISLPELPFPSSPWQPCSPRLAQGTNFLTWRCLAIGRGINDSASQQPLRERSRQAMDICVERGTAVTGGDPEHSRRGGMGGGGQGGQGQAATGCRCRHAGRCHGRPVLNYGGDHARRRHARGTVNAQGGKSDKEGAGGVQRSTGGLEGWEESVQRERGKWENSVWSGVSGRIFPMQCASPRAESALRDIPTPYPLHSRNRAEHTQLSSAFRGNSQTLSFSSILGRPKPPCPHGAPIEDNVVDRGSSGEQGCEDPWLAGGWPNPCLCENGA